MRNAILLRKVQGKLTACLRSGWLSMTALRGASSLSSLAFALSLLLVPVVLVLGLLALMLAPTPEPSFATLPMSFALAGITLSGKTRADLDKIIAECEAIEAKHAGKPMPEAEGKKLADLYAEGESLSKEINDAAAVQRDRERQMKQMKGASAWLSEVPDPALPGGKSTQEQSSSRIAGYMSIGAFAVMTQAYKAFRERGCKGVAEISFNNASFLPVRSLQSPEGLVALTHEEAKAVGELRSQFEAKDLPVLGTDVIAPNRVDRFVQDTRPDRLTLRDILNVSPTSSPVIQYLAEVGYTEGAEVQSEGATVATTALKGDSDIEYEMREETVKTIATTIPVTEQQMADAPALMSRINSRLLWDLRKKEEQLCGYGDGSALQFKGFFDSSSGVSAISPSGGDTLLDIIRRCITGVMTDGYEANGVWLHPEDWETIELLKGSDGHYIWAIIRDTLGPRVWGVRVVEGVGTREAGQSTTNLLVGDFQRGAVLYDRLQPSLAIGWIDDQFKRNLRTVRAEERAVLCVEAPKAFRKYETAA